MIESVIVDRLRTDSFIASKLGVYNNKATAFADVVPEGAPFPCITVRVMAVSVVDAVIQVFNIYVDYWDYQQIDPSREKGKLVASRIEELFDGYRFTGVHPRYSDIRFRFLSGYAATAAEYDGIHHNCFLGARACRKKWIDNIS